jgi:hypothetical protein
MTAKKAKPLADRFPLDATIKVLIDGNPRREGSETHERFALYRSGMKVGTFIERGGWFGDLRWDVARKHIELVPAAKAAKR